MANPFKHYEYDEKDFSHENTYYKGEPRFVNLDGWVFDKYNQIFYKEKEDQIVSISFRKGAWHCSLCSDANLIDFEIFDDLTDAFRKGNELI